MSTLRVAIPSGEGDRIDHLRRDPALHLRLPPLLFETMVFTAMARPSINAVTRLGSRRSAGALLDGKCGPNLLDKGCRADCFRVYNDWLAEYCSYAPKHNVGLPMISEAVAVAIEMALIIATRRGTLQYRLRSAHISVGCAIARHPPGAWRQ